MRLWPRKKTAEELHAQAEAEEAKHVAKLMREEAEQRQSEVDKQVASLRRLRQENHFGTSLDKIYREGA